MQHDRRQLPKHDIDDDEERSGLARPRVDIDAESNELWDDDPRAPMTAGVCRCLRRRLAVHCSGLADRSAVARYCR